MGVFTDDMARLRGEVEAFRKGRTAFLSDVKNNVATMLAGFREAHLREAHAGMDRRTRTRTERAASVGSMLAGFREDMAGAHRAWFGPTL